MSKFPLGKLSHKRIERLLRTGKLHYRLGGYSVRLVKRYTLIFKNAGSRKPCSYISNIRTEEEAVFLYERDIDFIKKQVQEKKSPVAVNNDHGAIL